LNFFFFFPFLKTQEETALLCLPLWPWTEARPAYLVGPSLFFFPLSRPRRLRRPGFFSHPFPWERVGLVDREVHFFFFPPFVFFFSQTVHVESCFIFVRQKNSDLSPQAAGHFSFSPLFPSFLFPFKTLVLQNNRKFWFFFFFFFQVFGTSGKTDLDPLPLSVRKPAHYYVEPIPPPSPFSLKNRLRGGNPVISLFPFLVYGQVKVLA